MLETEIKPIFVRLSAAERRRIRTLAVSQGLTMREAIVQAFDAWATQLRSGTLPRQGPSAGAQTQTAGAPSKGRRQAKQASTGRQVRPPAEASPSETGPSFTVDDLFRGLSASAEDWPERAAQLDWSSCPAAERVQTKNGNIWVAAGTLVQLAEVFEAVAGGNSLTEIAEVYGFSLQQLITLLQAAAQGLAGGASER